MIYPVNFPDLILTLTNKLSITAPGVYVSMVLFLGLKGSLQNNSFKTKFFLEFSGTSPPFPTFFRDGFTVELAFCYRRHSL